MLQLKKISKIYKSSTIEVEALKDVDIELRKSEFVAVLGPSGGGKTTLLNIIGGLDRYDSGDLIINGKSTKSFKDKDWDAYRNYSVGFVFQNYNLIMHQSVLSNVELALTLSGVSKSERKKRAIKALEEVGLKDQIRKKPNQLSGGQMQRVAIARALVNDPDIVLADEPTGALDTETSVQIMEILKKISKDKLIVMVTHNPDLAEKYSSRIVKILDGRITDDSNPYREEDRKNEDNNAKSGKTSMNFKTALSLSLNNLMTKKGRTFLTAFAGSIGIIGIALILSLSSGVQNYINKVEEDTLSSYPITIEQATMDMSSVMEAMMVEDDKIENKKEGYAYSRNIMTDVISTVSKEVNTNNLEAFKKYLESDTTIKENSNAIDYSYDLDLNLYRYNEDGTYYQTNPSQVMKSFGEYGTMMETSASSGMMSMTTNVWTKLLDNMELLKTQYEVLEGRFPTDYHEVVLMVDEDNRISDYTLYSLGIKDNEEVKEMFKKLMNGEEVPKGKVEEYALKDFLDLKFKVLLNTDYYVKEKKIWTDKSNDEEYMKKKLEDAEEIKIVGVIRPKKDSNIISPAYGVLGYLKELEENVINKINDSKIVKEQKEKENINVFTNLEFMSSGTTATGASNFSIDSLSDEDKMKLAAMSESERIAYITALAENANVTLEDNLKTLGVVDLENPKTISIYPKSFESKNNIKNAIEEYNKKQEEAGKEDDVIEYNDLVGVLMNSVTTIIDVISYVLIAFVAISLVVSSIMIGIITYISVLERTKEIGILRSIGASKKDISRVFNAETFIVGLTAGAIGIIVTILLNIPINLIINSITGIYGLSKLPVGGAIVLIIISMALTVIAGLVPSKMAAKKDPVEALRTE